MSAPPLQSADAIRAWLVDYIAKLLEFEPDEVKTGIPLARYGLDSIAAVALCEELGAWLDQKIEPELLYQHRTIDALATHLSSTPA